ncbi:uncharacterized protein LOC121393399 [Xenopus laevis]|uniref:Uncharacterized protein LOC121393399 n=1 Tax=Xenopus laevis TaxID=8355 RepID=A0A8J1KNG6_XENLA|nr:uncharacterized protein LOC121393399 [Xenopus laevis]
MLQVSVGVLERRSISSTVQYSRAESHYEGSGSLQTTNSGRGRLYKIRQRGSSCLYQVSRRHQEQSDDERIESHHGVCSNISDGDNSNPHSGESELKVDLLSCRSLDSGEWSLNYQVFRKVMGRWGWPDLDLMASPENHKLPVFLARVPCREAWAIDAFAHSWDNLWAYMFPPFAMIFKVLKKILISKFEIIAILPDWPRRPWYPLLRRLSVDRPMRLPDRQDLLSQGPLLHAKPQQLNLTAWRLSSPG